MSRVKLTKRLVEGASAADRDLILWDSEVPGFGCKITPTGKRTYLVYYRTRHGQQRRPAIGEHGVLTVEKARDVARQWLADVSAGGDPSAAKQAGRKAATVAQLAERYLTEYAAVHKKASSANEDARLIQNKVIPLLGKRPVEGVSRADVLHVQHALRNAPYEANRVISLLSKMFNLAEAWGVRPDGTNPCRHVRKFAERKRERFFSVEELGRLGAALDAIERASPVRLAYVDAIRLLALTGCRVSEVVGLRWEWVDLEGAQIALPDAKAGARIVPLGQPAIDLLRTLRHGEGAWVLSGSEADKPLSKNTVEHAWQRIRATADLQDARLHDLRHTVGTYSGQSGHNAFIVRDLLGHKTLAMTGRYVSRDADPLRLAADHVAARIAAAMVALRKGGQE